MHRSTIILSLLLFGILLLCSGCLTLGQHETKFTACPDNLEIDFDGVLLVDEVCLNTNERKDTQSAMNGWEHKIRKRLIAEGATYSLDANSDGSIDLEINLKRRYRDFKNENLLEFYSFQYLGNGVFELSAKRDRRNRLDYLAKGFSESDFRNTIAFRPLEGVNVLKHNADSKPGILARSYTWDNPQASDDGMSITFEIPAIKQAIAEARAKREQERKAEEQRRKAEMMARLDQYAQQLAEHRKQVITGPKKALETWREFKIELTNPKITFFPDAAGTQQAEFSCKVFIQNTGDQSVVLSNGLIIVIRTPDGRRTMDFPTLEAGKRSFDSFQPGASRTLELRTSLATGEQARLLAGLTRGGQCSVGIRPTRLKIYENGRNRGDLTPDGAAFVCPEPPALQMQAADREEKQRWIKYIEARVRAAGAPAADAEVPVLPAATFDSPLVWYTLTAENQLPAVD